MKFDEFFKNPVLFNDGYYIVSGVYTKEQAKQLFEKEIGNTIIIDNIETNRVRFGYPPEDIEDQQSFEGKSIWFSGARGKGSKKVWIYSEYVSMIKEQSK